MLAEVSEPTLCRRTRASKSKDLTTSVTHCIHHTRDMKQTDTDSEAALSSANHRRTQCRAGGVGCVTIISWCETAPYYFLYSLSWLVCVQSFYFCTRIKNLPIGEDVYLFSFFFPVKSAHFQSAFFFFFFLTAKVSCYQWSRHLIPKEIVKLWENSSAWEQ